MRLMPLFDLGHVDSNACHTQGHAENVQLVRMATADIMDRRRLFELFASLKDRASGMYLCYSFILKQTFALTDARCNSGWRQALVRSNRRGHRDGITVLNGMLHRFN